MRFSLAPTDLVIAYKAADYELPSLDQFAEKLRARVGGWRSTITTLENRSRLDDRFMVIKVGPEYFIRLRDCPHLARATAAV